MKRLWICFYTIMTIIVAGLLFKYFYNEKQIREYDRGNYEEYFDVLKYFNLPQPYIPYYNNGNVFYQRKEYGKAADFYRQALSKYPTKKAECDIRVNLALSMCYGLGEDYAKPEKVEESILVLKEARDILLEKGCATDENDGHDEEAQKLKNELDEIIEQLENPPPPQGGQDGEEDDQSSGGSGEGDGDDEEGEKPSGNGDEENDDQDGSDEGQNDMEQQIRDELMQQQDENYQERSQGMERNREDSNWNFSWDDEIW